MSSNPLQIVDITNPIEKSSKELLNALTTQGFVFIEGHNFTQNEVDKIFELSKEFFELPYDYKSKFSKTNNSNSGYIHFDRENLDPNNKKDFKEGLNLSEINFKTGIPSGPIPDWIINDPDRIEFIPKIIIKLNELALQLLRILAVGLKIEDLNNTEGKEWFTSRYKSTSKSGSTLRFLHYPKLTSTNDPIRAGAHTDYGSMTLLFQRENQEGLEIYNNKKWEKVPFIKSFKTGDDAPPIIVNIGDLLSYWTSGLLKSTIHRVKFNNESLKEDRYSIVFFSHPSDETLLEPVPSECIRDLSGRGVNKDQNYITALQHLQKKIANTYG
ncbi:uncharacterized protein KGF55_000970 [Candida pseudojiufengensis]|uniref:uncharacterized protein n=1 Tax=Candida pseudojiufengensis TaxID=497109 RepID=UPI0022241157|nr:uncharacterized protein KGF55_000970 [Candida pseudojiufengensis]KAI5965608.1 hypothetical protein KGF55_000970 [Candida pseudojiufengensis]